MVKEFYDAQGFTKISDNNGDTVWKLNIDEDYKYKHTEIAVNKE